MHFRIESVMTIINKSVPFESVTELDLSTCWSMSRKVRSAVS